MTASKDTMHSWIAVVTKPRKGSSHLKFFILDWKSSKSVHTSETFEGQEESIFAMSSKCQWKVSEYSYVPAYKLMCGVIV